MLSFTTILRYSVVLLAPFGSSIAEEIPVTGTPARGLEAFDTAMTDLMTKYHIPGGALAVVKDGRLAFAHGYGYADVEAKQTVLPDALFRIASSSKPITATAILKLIEQGKLTIDTPAFALLNDLPPLPGATVDPRLASITIRHLLEHKAGWEGGLFDVVWMPFTVRQAGSFDYPVTCEDSIRYMKGRPLDFDPGSKSVYSNFGYCVLGRVIERVSGVSYVDCLKTNVLEPAGLKRTDVGNTLVTRRYASEVRYYPYPGEPPAASIFGPTAGLVPWPYGGFYVEGFDSFAGLVTNTMDLLRFVTSSNGTRSPELLQSPPPGFVAYVPPTGANYLWYFQGSLPGSRSMMALLPDRSAFAVLFNSCAPLVQNVANNDYQLTDEILMKIVNAYRSISAWPTTDVWKEYSPNVIVKRFVHGATFASTSVAPNSWVTLTGTNLSSATLPVNVVPLPSQIADTRVTVKDSSGTEQPAQLSYASPQQVNFLLPASVAPGNALLTVTSSSGMSQQVPIQVTTLAPGLFTANSSGEGVPAATAFILKTTGESVPVTVFTCGTAPGTCASVPIAVPSGGDRLFLTLYGTGIRSLRDLSDVTVQIGRLPVPVLYAGSQPDFAGLDQVNVEIPATFPTRGVATLTLTVAGQPANTVQILLR